MKDKEFKARNKDTDFSKKIETDTFLGRQSARESTKPFNFLGRNKPYQQKFSENEKPLDIYTVQNPSGSQKEILKPTENNTEQQEDLENVHIDRLADIPHSPPSSKPPNKGGFSNAVTRAAQNKRYRRKFNQKTFDADFSKQNTEHSADNTAEEMQRGNAEPIQENKNYNFQGSAHNPDEAFDRVIVKSDFQLGRAYKEKSTEKSAEPKKQGQRLLYQDKTTNNKAVESTDAADNTELTEQTDFQLGEQSEPKFTDTKSRQAGKGKNGAYRSLRYF